MKIVMKIPTKEEKRKSPNYVQFWIKIDYDSSKTDITALCQQLTEHGIPWFSWDEQTELTNSYPPASDSFNKWPQYNYECRWGNIVFDGCRYDECIRRWPPEWVIEL